MARRKRTELDFRPLIEKLKKVPGALKAGLQPLIEQEARLFISGGRGTPGIIELTPPANAGHRGVKAKKQGENAVARDIFRIYATAQQAMQSIKDVDPEAARVFWKLYRTGDFKAAGQMLRDLGGGRYKATQSFAKFDGGTMHKRFRGKNSGRVTRERVMMVVTDAAELKAYVRKMQGKVGLLASGWQTAAARLKVKLPAWITRHGTGRGGITIEMGADKMVIVISNRVKYGEANDLQRRADYVMKYRKAALQRRLPYVIKAALKNAGFQTRGGGSGGRMAA